MVDTRDTINCPACQKEMKKVFMAPNGLFLDICTEGCGGIWFDNRELKEFDEKHENIDEILKACEGKTFNKVETSNKRGCPACGARMVKNFVSAKQEIEVDECYSCGGKFFDYDELQKMREQYDSDAERSAEFLKYAQVNCGYDIQQWEIENQLIEANKSPLRKLFDKFVWS